MKCRWFWHVLFFILVISENFISSSFLRAQEINQPKKPEFSIPRGFYENSFDVVVSSSEFGTQIKYTLDGSDPKTSSTAIIKDSPATIRIDPESTEGNRGKTPGAVLRANSFRNNSYSETVTHTYLFINKIAELSPEGKKPGPNWPEPYRGEKSQFIDYGLASDVFNNPKYKDLIDDAFLSIPSISIATDLSNLFDPKTGIYMNAMMDGIDWERPASIELIYPDGTKGFQINAGIRIRGGWSRHNDNPKHAFRLFFRKEYGKGKLEYPLFDNEGVAEFDKIDLRTSQNYSWSYPGHLSQYNTMNRDVFARDLQRETGQPYTRSRYYHLYINGVYWGLYQSQERAEASFAESYLGGKEEDYDVIKPGDNNHQVEATDGNMDAYEEIWKMCLKGFSANENYFKLLGRNPDGSRNQSYKVLVDVDNLIDFMLNIFYTGNFDSPTSKFGGDNLPNNFFCIYNRNGESGFKFFIHDAEHILRTTAGEGPGIGLNENRVSINMNVTSIGGFHPQWLHYKLTSNKEYRIRFADHVYKHFFNEGCMTPQKATSLFLSRAKEIEMAIIAESARWGNTTRIPSYTKDDWQWAINDIVNNYFPYRTNIVLNQLKAANLYPNINPPIFKNNNNEITSTYLTVNPNYKIKLLNPNNSKGTIKYTLDGSDPRLIGGNVSNSAIDGGNEVELEINSTTVIKARVLDGTTWSALHEITLFADNNFSNLKLTEIHYHPLDNDTINDDEYEFIELKNIGTTPINLSNAYFSSGINYTFPSNTVIEPNKFVVLASNRKEFNNRYGFYPFDEYKGKLDNGGETLTLLSAANDTIFSVTYDDVYPWPVEADGQGYSLTANEINSSGNMNDPSYWRKSYSIHGSPGKDDLPTSVDDYANPIKYDFELYQNYPNPFNVSTKIVYEIPKDGAVKLCVYDILGREIKVVVNKFQYAGRYAVNLSMNEFVSGIYFYQLKFENKIITKKLMLIK
ncbi:MAG: CotH kinase family protein [Candidatus Anstonellales archaeon]